MALDRDKIYAKMEELGQIQLRPIFESAYDNIPDGETNGKNKSQWVAAELAKAVPAMAESYKVVVDAMADEIDRLLNFNEVILENVVTLSVPAGSIGNSVDMELRGQKT